MASKFVQGNWLLPNNVNANKQSNYSLDFNSSNNTIINLDSAINLSDTCSISFWINLTATSGTNYTNNAPIGSATNYIVFLNNAGGVMWFRVGGNYLVLFNGNGDQSQSLNNFLTAGSWHHIVVTRNQDDISVYINGYKRATNTQSSFSGDTVVSSIGAQGNNANNTTGKIDEVTFYTRVLTDGGVATDSLASGDIATLYSSGTPGNPFELSGDPVVYYKLGETAIGQAPGGTWDWQVPNHAQTQLAWGGDSTAALSPQASIGLPVGGENLGTVHTLSYWINNNNVSLTNSKAGQWFCKEASNDMFMSGSGVADRGVIFGNNYSSINAAMPVNGVYITYRTGGSTSTTNMQFPLGSIDLLDNQTYNIIFVRNGSSVKCFINGQEITNPVGSIDSTYELIFDSINFNNYYSLKTEWKGIMSNVAIWKSDRESEVTNIYNNGEPQSNYTTAPDLWYKLDDTTTSYPAQYKRAINQSLSSESYVKSYLKQPFSGGGATSQLNSIVSVLDTDLNLGTSYSFSFWMALDPLKTEFNGYYNVNCYYLGTTGSNGTAFGAADGGILFQSGDGYGSSNVGIRWNVYDTNGNSTGNITFNNSSTPSYTNASDGNFHNYMFVKDGQTVSFYFDNQLVDSGTMSGELSNTILNNINGGNNLLGGHARQLRWAEWSFFANKVLSSSERATIYNSGNPGDISSVSPSLWYSYDNIDVTNNKLIDKSSSNNDASTVRILNTTQNTDAFQGKYIKYMDGVQSIYNNNLSSTDLGLYNPLYSQFSTLFNSNHFIIPDSPTTAVNNNSSISFWVKTNTTGNRHGILNKRDGGGQVYYVYVNIDNTIAIDGGGTHQFSTGTITQGEWAHVALTISSGSVIFYINGSSAGTGTVNLTADDAPTYLGSKTGGADPSNAYLSNVALFIDKTLSASEVISIYNNGKPSDISSLSPTAWWKLGDAMYTNSSNKYLLIDSINSNNSTSVNNYAPSISADAPKVLSPGVSSGLVELDKEGNAPNSTSNSISYNILKTDQSIYTPKYVSQYTVDNNYSMAFDGVDDYFDAGNINEIEVSDFTVSLWVKFNGNQNSMMFFSGTSLSTNSTYVQRSNNDLYFGLGAQSNYIQSTPTVANNVWHHIVVVATGTSGKIYLNGSDTSASGAALSSTRTNLGQNFTIGKGLQTNGSNGFFVGGQIDEFAVFNKALTADQIKFDIYGASATANKSADFINNPNLPTPVAWYRMGD